MQSPPVWHFATPGNRSDDSGEKHDVEVDHRRRRSSTLYGLLPRWICPSLVSREIVSRAVGASAHVIGSRRVTAWSCLRAHAACTRSRVSSPGSLRGGAWVGANGQPRKFYGLRDVAHTGCATCSAATRFRQR